MESKEPSSNTRGSKASHGRDKSIGSTRPRSNSNSRRARNRSSDVDASSSSGGGNWPDSSQQFKDMHDRFKTTQQQQRYRHIKKKVDAMRDIQQQIFLDQIQHFPIEFANGVGPTHENYSQIWDSFQQDDSKVKDLVKKLGDLTKLVDSVNKLGGHE